MKPFNGYDEAKKAAQYTPGEKLPKGAYVCKILGALIETGKEKDGEKLSDMMQIQFEIEEGEYKDFFKKQYEASTNEDKKYKGKVKIYLPKDDGSEKDGWTKNSFAKWTNSLEESNPGYTWDWNEKKWKDKLIGLVFGETGTVINGKEVVYTECRFPVSIETVRSGKAPEAKFKAKNGYTGNGATEAPATDNSSSFMDIAADLEDELPFK